MTDYMKTWANPFRAVVDMIPSPLGRTSKPSIRARNPSGYSGTTTSETTSEKAVTDANQSTNEPVRPDTGSLA